MTLKKCGPKAQDGTVKAGGFGFVSLAQVQSPSRRLVMSHPNFRPAQKVVFRLDSALAKTDSTATATIIQAFRGQLTQQFDIVNPAGRVNNMFFGDAGDRGWAMFDTITKKYIISRLGSCCPGCTLFSDAFTRSNSSDLGANWDELAGDWSISSNALTVSATVAAVQCKRAARNADMTASATITCPSTGDLARVCVRMTDEDNYLFAELDFSGASGTLKIYQRTSGSDGSAINSDTATITPGSTYTLLVCVEGTTLSAIASNSDGRISRVTGTVSATTSQRAGLATGGTLSSSATFDGFDVQQRKSSCQNCGLAGTSCSELPYSNAFSTDDPFWIIAGGMAVTGGQLVVATSPSSASSCFATPSASTFSLTATGTIVTQATDTTTSRLAINGTGFGVSLIANNAAGSYTASWDGGSSGISQDPADGDVLKIVISKTSGTTYDVSFYINDDLKHSESGVSGTFGSTFNGQLATAGIAGSSDTVFDDFSMEQTA